MPFQLTYPAYLLLLPVLLAVAWWVGRRSLASLAGPRRFAANALRGVVILLLVLALTRLQLVDTRHALCTIFVLDASASVPHELQEAALNYVNAAVKRMHGDDRAALIVFGSDAYIELPPSAASRVSRIYSRPNANYTDIAAALRLALAALPEGMGGQVVLLSDGNENLGSAVDQALACKTAGVRIHTVALRSEIEAEALLERAATPCEVKLGEPFEISIVATATKPTRGRVRIFRNSEYLGEQAVQLMPGKSLITVPQSLERPGFYTYEALLDAGPDTITENNRALAFTRVRGKPRVAVLAGAPEQAKHIARALAGRDVEVSLRGPESVPTTLAGWRDWDAAVFADIPAFSITPDQMLMIQSYVRDLGGGFAMVGGENSFGAGGYFKTPVEEALPVDMSIRKQKMFPSLAVMLIMDTSGSSGMPIDGVQMIRLEAESAVQVVELMQSVDQIGVIVSGEGVDVIAPIRYARDKNAIVQDLSRMQPGGGGIFCRPSMEAAYALMKPVKARTKHIIMLADGSDCDEQDGCDEIAALMRRDKMTFSTVSFGLGPHTPFLERVARIGGGQFYLATRADQLPRIFTRDAMLASKSLIVEEPFKPKADAGAEVLRGVDLDSMPLLLGYVATTPKPLASQPLITHRDDPLLATWRYGLGRSVAFTSDAEARWAAHWLGWRDFGKFWAQAVRWMLKRGGYGNWQTTVEESRGVGKVTVEALDAHGRFINFLDLEARVVRPDLKAETVRLDQTAPGRYEAQFPIRDVGAYLVTVTQRGKTDSPSQTAGVLVPYPPEYKDLKPNEFLLHRIADMTGGKMDPAPESIFGGKREAARFPQDAWTLLVLLAALLWPADVAVRRLAIEMAQVRAAAWRVRGLARGAWRAVRGRAPVEPVHEPTLAHLLRSRQTWRAGQSETAQKPAVTVFAAPSERDERPAGGVKGEPAPAESGQEAPAAQESDALARLKAAKRRARKAAP